MSNTFLPNCWSEWYLWTICSIQKVNITNLSFSLLKYESLPYQENMNIVGSLYIPFFCVWKLKGFSIIILYNTCVFIFIKYLLVFKNTSDYSCEDSSIFFSPIISVEIFSNFSLNVIISLVDISCFHYVTRFYISKNKSLQKLQHMIVVNR